MLECTYVSSLRVCFVRVHCAARPWGRSLLVDEDVEARELRERRLLDADCGQARVSKEQAPRLLRYSRRSMPAYIMSTRALLRSSFMRCWRVASPKGLCACAPCSLYSVSMTSSRMCEMLRAIASSMSLNCSAARVMLTTSDLFSGIRSSDSTVWGERRQHGVGGAGQGAPLTLSVFSSSPAAYSATASLSASSTLHVSRLRGVMARTMWFCCS